MKLILNKNEYKINPVQLLRRAGYGVIIDRRRGKESFVRHPGRERYPRFHVYFEDSDEKMIFNIHLDQKAPIYPGIKAHNAEYDSELVEREASHLRQIANEFKQRNIN